MQDIRKTMASCFEQVAFFFEGGDPYLQESFSQRAQYLDRKNYEREVLFQALQAYHERLGAPSKTMENISFLRDGKALAVVTGQQAGLFTGPLYTLYKALTAIRLAAEQSMKLKRPVVPVFWIAGEDHDWAEICSTVFLNEEGSPVTCTLPGQGEGLAIGRLPVPDWDDFGPQVLATLPQGQFREEVIEVLKNSTEKAENLSDWFALVLQWLVQGHGLIIFDPQLTPIKTLGLSVYRHILERTLEIREALLNQTTQWTKLGYPAQIQLTGEEAFLFLEMPERRALMWNGLHYYLRGQSDPMTLSEVLDLMGKEPQRFSPNVVTRPIVQENLLPVLAYVAGPGELNYWAQLGGVFQSFGLKMPIVFSRLSVIALTPAWQKIMESEEISLESARHGLAVHRERCVREQDTFDIDGKFIQSEQAVEQIYENLRSLAGIHPNIAGLIEQNQVKVKAQMDYLKGKIWQAQRKRCEQSLQRIQKLENALFPLGFRQERILNPLSFVIRYGLEFVEQVAALPLIKEPIEQVIKLRI